MSSAIDKHQLRILILQGSISFTAQISSHIGIQGACDDKYRSFNAGGRNQSLASINTKVSATAIRAAFLVIAPRIRLESVYYTGLGNVEIYFTLGIKLKIACSMFPSVMIKGVVNIILANEPFDGLIIPFL